MKLVLNGENNIGMAATLELEPAGKGMAELCMYVLRVPSLEGGEPKLSPAYDSVVARFQFSELEAIVKAFSVLQVANDPR
jgi:hypothetical protein